MGKSSQSCFKILACGTHSVENEDLQATDRKSSSDRRGWSFRKRSARHRVLSNSVSSELALSVNKENPESKSVGVETGLDVSEKTPVIQLAEEKPILPTQPETKLSEIIEANEDIRRDDDILNEASIIIIQSAIRGFLAQKVLWKSKNIIKLQAAIRGHRVRRHAVGTLRCVKAIIRIQKLVRARRVCSLKNDSGDSKEYQGMKEAKPNDRYIYVSIDKLLSNAFANQLMESMPRTNAMYIKCQPLKSEDSSWKWFQRWMSVSAASNEEKQETVSASKELKIPALLDVIEDDAPAHGSHAESKTVEPDWSESAEASEDESNQIVYNANDLNHHLQKQDLGVTEVTNKDEPRTEPLETETKIFSIDQPETEVKKFIRKASNPAFIAAQSKFEDLSSAAAPVKSSSFSSYDSGLKSSLDKYSSATDQSIRSRDTALADGAISTASGLQIGGSECGTELSISSTLDSPDGSEVEIAELQQETKGPHENACHRNGWSSENGTQSNEFGESENPIKDPESNQTEPHLEVGSDTRQRVNKPSSPEGGSPKSQMSHNTVPVSSQVSSSKPKKRKSETSESHRKSKYNQDSISRNSLEQSNEHRSARRRSSFGSGKLDQEPRDSNSSSSNFVPGYMQATESARAKTISNGSPRSSPDVIDKDIYTKKRHSLPGANERQESPRIQRSLSQAQQNGKGNGTQSPQERKWRR